jgi:hypothetical protein
LPCPFEDAQVDHHFLKRTGGEFRRKFLGRVVNVQEQVGHRVA